MRHGIHIPAGVVWLLTLAVVVFGARAVAREMPAMKRYLKIERM